jgi:HK97 family phage major capsid protein
MRPTENLSARLEILKDRYTEAQHEVNRLEARIEDGDRDPLTEGEAEHYTRSLVARDRAKSRLEAQLRRTKKAKRSGGATRSVKSVDVGPTLLRDRARLDPWDLSTLQATRGPVGPYALTRELRARAHDAIERAPDYVLDEHRESAASLVDSKGESPDVGPWNAYFAQYILEHSSPRYTQAFFEYLRVGDAISNEARSILGSTGPAGGFLSAAWTDPTIILQNSGTVNHLRALATVKTVPTQQWLGVASAAVVAEWSATATEFSDGGPSTFTEPSITPVRAEAHVTASRELASDSDIAEQVLRLMTDARNVLEGTALISGTGGVQQPQGLVSKLAGVTTSRLSTVTSHAVGPVDAMAMLSKLPARYVNNASFMSHWFLQSILRSQAQAQPSLIADIGPRQTLMLGMPYYLSSAMLNATGGTVLSTSSQDQIALCADFASAYTIVDRIGLEVVYNDGVVGAQRRPTNSVSWSGFWRTSADVTNTDAAVLLVTA